MRSMADVLNKIVEDNPHLKVAPEGGRIARLGDYTEDGRRTSMIRPGAAAQCQMCMDVGKVRRDLPPEDPGFGKSVDCPACKGGASLVSVSTVLIEAGVPPEFVGFTEASWLGKFRHSPGADEAITAIRAIQGNRRALGNNVLDARGLLMVGKPGTGKTSAAVVLLAGLAHRTRSMRWITWPAFLDGIKASWGSDRQLTITQAVSELAFADLLVVDEIGQEGNQVSEWQADVARQLAEVRWRAASNAKLTIWTSNLDVGGLEDQFGAVVGAAVVSRIAGMSKVIEFSGDDVRRSDS